MNSTHNRCTVWLTGQKITVIRSNRIYYFSCMRWNHEPQHQKILIVLDLLLTQYRVHGRSDSFLLFSTYYWCRLIVRQKYLLIYIFSSHLIFFNIHFYIWYIFEDGSSCKKFLCHIPCYNLHCQEQMPKSICNEIFEMNSRKRVKCIDSHLIKEYQSWHLLSP